MKTTPRQTVSLCPECSHCPTVEIHEDGTVRIGEAPNVTTLGREEWNQLVRGIRSGVLGEL
ncbi:MAG: hypothetical protein HY337_08270 [Gemmatimonadetes bacterium]|nr:hypothetical protein [Gemmatimonadota bacterium]